MPTSEQIGREDLVLFINSCFACTGQDEFYGGADGQAVSIHFLHEYILGNYRKLYARTLAAGVNHYNQGLIILNLLARGQGLGADERALRPPYGLRADGPGAGAGTATVLGGRVGATRSRQP